MTVMGLGLFGGGAGVTRFLAERGADVVLTDLRGEEILRESLDALAGYPIKICLGKHEEKHFQDVDLIVANPAVPDTSPYLLHARERRILVETEVSLFLQLCAGSVIGITGSNGKTTTTVLTGKMLEESGTPVWVGGNVGGSLLEHLDAIGTEDWLVMELSSFQLEYLGRKRWKPAIAVLTNISPNHLDRHGTMENYVEAKRNIVRFQEESDAFLYLKEDPVGKEWALTGAARSYAFSPQSHEEEGAWVGGEDLWIRLGEREERLCSLSSIRIPGRFNRCNVLAAALAARLAGAPCAAIARAVEHFSGVEHRLELVGSVEGTLYFNDSVSTTPESTIAALEALPGSLLIVGGYDKGLPFEAMAQVIREKARGVIVIGQVAGQLERLLSGQRGLDFWRAESLEEAVRKASKESRSGERVVLSPGCASYDMFRNYAERGRTFKELVQEL